jgi:predicted DNA-binding transcriptional regulator AlpA
MTATTAEPLWDINEVSAFLKIPPGTLYQWRHRRKGPPSAKVGRHLRYNPDDVRAWLANQAAAQGAGNER